MEGSLFLTGDALKLAELLNVAVEVFRNFTAQSSPFNTDKVWKGSTNNPISHYCVITPCL